MIHLSRSHLFSHHQQSSLSSLESSISTVHSLLPRSSSPPIHTVSPYICHQQGLYRGLQSNTKSYDTMQLARCVCKGCIRTAAQCNQAIFNSPHVLSRDSESCLIIHAAASHCAIQLIAPAWRPFHAAAVVSDFLAAVLGAGQACPLSSSRLSLVRATAFHFLLCCHLAPCGSLSGATALARTLQRCLGSLPPFTVSPTEV